MSVLGFTMVSDGTYTIAINVKCACQEAEVRKSRWKDLDPVSNLPSLNAEASIHRGSLKYVPGAKSLLLLLRNRAKAQKSKGESRKGNG